MITALVRQWRRILFLLRRDRLHDELAEELEFHRAERAAENLRAGAKPEAAQVSSRKQMGNITIAKEECREMWSFMAIERLFQDVRYAMRLFGKAPGFTAIAVLSLALGIGGNAAMFSLVHQLLLQPLAYPHSERLVRITGIYPRAAIPYFQQRSRTMDIAAVSPGSDLNLTGQGIAARLTSSTVSANFFSVLGVQAERGRAFAQADDLPGRDRIVLISHALWMERFGGDAAAVGRIITLDGVNRQVVGILPQSFHYPSPKVQAWIPGRLDPSDFLEYSGRRVCAFHRTVASRSLAGFSAA